MLLHHSTPALLFPALVSVLPLLLCGLSAAVAAVNNRPVIGILTLPCESHEWCPDGSQFFASSYVKQMEAAGARVVPLFYNASHTELTSLLSQLNGALFTGGGASLRDTSKYYHAIQTIYSYVIQANSNGDYFPLWGTCLGFEAICRAASNDPHILSQYDAENYTIPLSFTDNAFKIGRMFDVNRFGSGVNDVYKYLSSLPITMNNHQMGVSPNDFQQSSALSSTFDILATNKDRDGKSFVSLIQGKSFPIYGSQFHPEKNAFEFDINEVIQHTLPAIQSSQHLATFFVDEARKNSHQFPDVDDYLIYNYDPVFTNTNFAQCYVW